MANFLERRADGGYKIRQTPEEVVKGLVFLCNISVIWKGVGRYQLPNEREIKQAEHWSLYECDRRYRQVLSLL